MHAPRERASHWPSHSYAPRGDLHLPGEGALTASTYRLEGSISEGRGLGGSTYLHSTTGGSPDHDTLMMTASLERAAIKVRLPPPSRAARPHGGGSWECRLHYRPAYSCRCHSP